MATSYQDEALLRLERVEKRYHLFKAVWIMLLSVMIMVFVAYESNKSVNSVNSKNERVEKLMRCSLPAFTPKNYNQADDIIKKCLSDTGS